MESANQINHLSIFTPHIIPLLPNNKPTIKDWQDVPPQNTLDSTNLYFNPSNHIGIKCGKQYDILAIEINQLDILLDNVNIDTLILETDIDDRIMMVFRYQSMFDHFTSDIVLTSCTTSTTFQKSVIKFMNIGTYIPYDPSKLTECSNSIPQSMPNSLLENILSALNKSLINNQPLEPIFRSLNPRRFKDVKLVYIMRNIAYLQNPSTDFNNLSSFPIAKELYDLCNELSYLDYEEIYSIWTNKIPENKSNFIELKEWLKKDLKSDINSGFSIGLIELDDLDYQSEINKTKIKEFFDNNIFVISASYGKKLFYVKDYYLDPFKRLEFCSIRYNRISREDLIEQLSDITIKNAISNKANLLKAIKCIDSLMTDSNIKIMDLIDKAKLDTKIYFEDGTLADIFKIYINKNIYHSVIFLPYGPLSQNPITNIKWLNLFSGFKCKYNHDFMFNENLKPLLVSISELCGNTQTTNYLLDYLAHIVQFPNIKTEIGIVINTTDRNIRDFFEWFGREVLGEGYYSEIENGLENKLLILSDSNTDPEKLYRSITNKEILHGGKPSADKIINYSNHVIIGPSCRTDYKFDKLHINHNKKFISTNSYDSLNDDLFNLLLRRDISSETVKNLSAIQDEGIILTDDQLVKDYIFDLIKNGNFVNDIITIMPKDLLKAINDFAISNCIRTRITNNQKLEAAMFNTIKIRPSQPIQPDGKRPRIYILNKSNISQSIFP